MFTGARLRLVVTAALVLIGAFAVDAAGSGSKSRASGGWDATLQYVTALPPAFPRVSKLRLRVTRDGILAYNRAVALPRACEPSGCRLAMPSPGRPFALVDFGSDKGTVALIWLWTGGAHCCTVVRAVSIPAGLTAARNFRDSGARLAVIHALRVFVSADNRFAYLFTSYASSGSPLQIWRYRNGRFSDVTRMFPEEIATDAARWWAASQRARRARGEARGAFAAWAADTCAIGRAASVQRELVSAVRAGAFSPSRGEADGPKGAQYAAALRRKLRVFGYCR